MVARHDAGQFHAGRVHQARSSAARAAVGAGLEEIAGDHHTPDGLGDDYRTQRGEDQGKVGRRHGLAVAAAGLVVAEVQVGQHGRRRRQVDGDAGRSQQPFVVNEHNL